MPARHRLDRYDEYGQDTWTSPDEEQFAAEMGQPSTEPAPHHRSLCYLGHEDCWDNHTNERLADEADWRDETDQLSVVPFPHHRPAVLAQTPVRCNKCDRMAVPFEDVIVLVDGAWMHDECHES